MDANAGLLERIEKLEGENRRLKRLGLLFLLATGSFMLMGQAGRQPQVVEAQRFILRDDRGNLRGIFEGTDSGANFEMYAPVPGGGPPSIALYADATTRVIARDPHSRNTVVTFIDDGTANFGVSAANGNSPKRPEIILTAASGTGSTLKISDSGGAGRIVLESSKTASEESVVVSLSDGNEQPRVVLGRPLRNPLSNGSYSLGLLDGNGKVAWKAP